MHDRQNTDKVQEPVGHEFGFSGAGRFETILIAAGLCLYLAASAWGMARAGFRPCTAGSCIIPPVDFAAEAAEKAGNPAQIADAERNRQR
ncbi:MAG: hypothetical protein ACKO85_05470 [Isosphaeraceae bacterium]